MDRLPDRTDWNHLRAFLATAETGSLSAAARRLGLTQPTLGRQVAALAERLGLMASGRAQAIDGTIRITASDVFSAYLLPEIVERLRGLAPGLRVELVASNELADLLRREADIAIRHVRPEQPDLVARLLFQASARLYASRGYLAAHGRPRHTADLAGYDFVSLGDPGRMASVLQRKGVPVTAEHFRSGSENGLVAWELVRRGLGIAALAGVINLLGLPLAVLAGVLVVRDAEARGELPR